MQILLICLFLLLPIVLLLNIQLEIRLNIDDNKSQSYFVIRTLKGILSFKYNLSTSTSNKHIDTTGKEVRKKDWHRKLLKRIGKYRMFLRRYSNGFKKSILYMIKKLKIIKMDIDSLIGTGDPMATAISIGFINVFLINGLTHLHRSGILKTHRVMVKPEFTRAVFKLKFHCIIQIKLGYIIIAAFIVIRQIFIRW